MRYSCKVFNVSAGLLYPLYSCFFLAVPYGTAVHVLHCGRRALVLSRVRSFQEILTHLAAPARAPIIPMPGLLVSFAVSAFMPHFARHPASHVPVLNIYASATMATPEKRLADSAPLLALSSKVMAPTTSEEVWDAASQPRSEPAVMLLTARTCRVCQSVQPETPPGTAVTFPPSHIAASASHTHRYVINLQGHAGRRFSLNCQTPIQVLPSCAWKAPRRRAKPSMTCTSRACPQLWWYDGQGLAPTTKCSCLPIRRSRR